MPERRASEQHRLAVDRMLYGSLLSLISLLIAMSGYFITDKLGTIDTRLMRLETSVFKMPR